jgi:transcriptional regulator with XRE-family HTH domain
MDTTSTERSRELRARRKAKGLKQLSFWVRSEDEELARKVTKSFEAVALQEETEARDIRRAESLQPYLDEWHKWLDGQTPSPKHQPVSSQKQRLNAYRIARALGIEMPDDVTFSDYHLLRDWIKKQKKTKTGLVDKFVADQQK